MMLRYKGIFNIKAVLVITVVYLVTPSMAEICIWCDHYRSKDFLRCMGDQIRHNSLLKGLPEYTVDSLNGTMMTIAMAIKENKDIGKDMADSVMAGKLSELIILASPYSDIVTATAATMGVFGYCYIYVGGQAHDSYLEDFARRVDTRLIPSDAKYAERPNFAVSQSQAQSNANSPIFIGQNPNNQFSYNGNAEQTVISSSSTTNQGNNQPVSYNNRQPEGQIHPVQPTTSLSNANTYAAAFTEQNFNYPSLYNNVQQQGAFSSASSGNYDINQGDNQPVWNGPSYYNKYPADRFYPEEPTISQGENANIASSTYLNYPYETASIRQQPDSANDAYPLSGQYNQPHGNQGSTDIYSNTNQNNAPSTGALGSGRPYLQNNQPSYNLPNEFGQSNAGANAAAISYDEGQPNYDNTNYPISSASVSSSSSSSSTSTDGNEYNAVASSGSASSVMYNNPSNTDAQGDLSANPPHEPRYRKKKRKRTQTKSTANSGTNQQNLPRENNDEMASAVADSSARDDIILAKDSSESGVSDEDEKLHAEVNFYEALYYYFCTSKYFKIIFNEKISTANAKSWATRILIISLKGKYRRKIILQTAEECVRRMSSLPENCNTEIYAKVIAKCVANVFSYYNLIPLDKPAENANGIAKTMNDFLKQIIWKKIKANKGSPASQDKSNTQDVPQNTMQGNPKYSNERPSSDIVISGSSSNSNANSAPIYNYQGTQDSSADNSDNYPTLETYQQNRQPSEQQTYPVSHDQQSSGIWNDGNSDDGQKDISRTPVTTRSSNKQDQQQTKMTQNGIKNGESAESRYIMKIIQQHAITSMSDNKFSYKTFSKELAALIKHCQDSHPELSPEKATIKVLINTIVALTSLLTTRSCPENTNDYSGIAGVPDSSSTLSTSSFNQKNMMQNEQDYEDTYQNNFNNYQTDQENANPYSVEQDSSALQQINANNQENNQVYPEVQQNNWDNGYQGQQINQNSFSPMQNTYENQEEPAWTLEQTKSNIPGQRSWFLNEQTNSFPISNTATLTSGIPNGNRNQNSVPIGNRGNWAPLFTHENQQNWR